MAKVEERQKARNLRRKGLSIKVISKKLNVARSSVSNWCSDIELTTKQKNKLYNKMVLASIVGRTAGINFNKRKRLESINVERLIAEKLIHKITERDLLFIGLGLYWGEGSKNKERKFVFTNSDPASIKLIIKWLKYQGFRQQDIIFRVHINEIHKIREKKILKFWKKYLNISSTQMRKTIFIKVKNKKNYENFEEYYGVGRLTLKNSTKIKYRIMEMLDIVKTNLK